MTGVPTFVADSGTGYALTVVDLDPLRAAIRAEGAFDLAARQDLADALHHQASASRRFVWLDLSQVSLLDCSCLSVIVASHRRFLALQGLLVLSGVGDNVARVLRITGLDDVLFIVPADQDPFNGVLMARALPIEEIPTQRVDAADGFEPLIRAADRTAAS